jgi:peptidoglycan/LPS O-acetylase OafA/YrhL
MFDHLAKFRYRADIDGLRAIAVIGVVLFHAGLGVSGGFVGVDVFFVISGFLITSLILRDLDRGSFSIVDFWERRARRIFPALAVVVIVTLIAGWFLMLPFGFQVLGQSVVALTVFASNMQFWRTSGYFDPAAEENPLLHTWSLSVEEQFYLVVPLLLLLVFTLGRQKWVGILLSVGIVVSLVGAELWLRRDPSGSFYLLPSRAWELGAGSLLALARPLASSRLRGCLGWLGLALIFFTFFAYDAKTAFPGMAAIPPVLGTVLLIWSGMSDDEEISFCGAHRLLASKVLVGIGLLSYSFYLWHWPFFAFHRYLFSQAPAVPLAIGYIFIALLLSALSLRYVEKPFRKGKLVTSRKHVFLFTGLVSALVLIVGLSMWRTRGVPSRMPTVVAEYDAVKGDEKFPKSPVAGYDENNFTHLGEQGKPCGVVLWGDSHAGVLKYLIDELCKQNHKSGIAAGRGGVAPVIEWSGHDSSSALHATNLAFNRSVMEYIRKCSESGELKHVILAFRWSYYIDTPQRKADEPLPVDGFPDALIKTIQTLEKLGVGVSVLLEVPIFEMHVPKAVALHYWRGWPLPHLSIQEHAERLQSYEPLIHRLREETPYVNIIDASPSLFSEQGEVEFLNEKGVLLYRDDHHLTKTGSKRLKPLFEKLLLN